MSDANLPANTGNNQINPASAAGNIFQVRKTALKPTQYSARVTRKNPCAIVILIDQSGSMENETVNGFGEVRTKAKAVADIVNDLLESLTMKCQRDGLIKDYFNLLIIGYGKDFGDSDIGTAWEGGLEGKDWVTVSELKLNVKLETYSEKKTLPWGDVVEEVKTKKVWITPCHDYLTPMYAALKLCKEKINDWTNQYQDSFPPLIFNITDGAPSDIENLSDLTNICDEIKAVKTNDGNTLLINCLLTDGTSREVILPIEEEKSSLSDEYHLALFEGSSNLPQELKSTAYQIFQEEKFLHENIKGVVINSLVSTLIKLLNIGTNTVLSNIHD